MRSLPSSPTCCSSTSTTSRLTTTLSGSVRRWRCRCCDSLRRASGHLRLHGRAPGVARCACAHPPATKPNCCAAPTSSSPADRVCTRPGAVTTRTYMCLPSAVDGAHFAPASPARVLTPMFRRAWREIPAPRFGFFGVIDERVDTELLDAVARERPLWQFVMIGPVARIDCSQLPKRDNIHWLGQQPYETTAAVSSPAGMCACCRSPAMHRRDSSARRTTLGCMAAGAAGGQHAGARRRLRSIAMPWKSRRPRRISSPPASAVLRESGAERAQRRARMRAHVSAHDLGRDGAGNAQAD